jgi:putative transposase
MSYRGGHRRQSHRFRSWDYSIPAGYFVTICTQGRECILGEIADGEIHLSGAGEIVRAQWGTVPGHFPGVTLDEYTIMPNHFHGIVVITSVVKPRRGEVSSPHIDGILSTHIEKIPHPHIDGIPSPDFEEVSSPHIDGIASPLTPSPRLGTIIAYFKYRSTKLINQQRGTPGRKVFQRDFHDRIIRNEAELQHIRTYIRNNHCRWSSDVEHPGHERG